MKKLAARSRGMRRRCVLKRATTTGWGEKPVRGGTWNLRCLGASHGVIDPEHKMHCIPGALAKARAKAKAKAAAKAKAKMKAKAKAVAG